MIRFQLGLADLASTSFAYSALLETVLSLRMWTHPGHYAEQRPLFERMRPAFERLDTGLLTALVASNRWVPDILTPRPRGPWSDVRAELEMVRAEPPEALQADLRRTFLPHDRELPARLAQGLDEPQVLLAQIADALEEYWETCLAPQWWPRARSVLEADIVYRARRLAEQGAAGLFADLSHRLHWEDGSLTIRWDRPDPLPARGRATMAENQEPPPHAASLERLLGRPRARLLTMLSEPVSTTELARRLGVTPGAVSQHLAVLSAALLTTRARHGRMVLYARSRLGDELCGRGAP